MSTYIAVDIGGTHIRSAAFEEDNPEPLSHQRVRSYAREPGIFDRLVATIKDVWPGSPSSSTTSRPPLSRRT